MTAESYICPIFQVQDTLWYCSIISQGHSQEEPEERFSLLKQQQSGSLSSWRGVLLELSFSKGTNKSPLWIHPCQDCFLITMCLGARRRTWMCFALCQIADRLLVSSLSPGLAHVEHTSQSQLKTSAKTSATEIPSFTWR